MSVTTNLESILQNIQNACRISDRDQNEINLIGVTKYVTIDRAREAMQAGINQFGENRLEGLLEKHQEIGNEVIWHFIGSLQSRKVKEIIDKVDYIHSLDRKSLAKEINKRTDKPMNCFVQVNISEEESKHGLKQEEVEPFIEMLANYSNIKVVGLMTMAPYVEDDIVIRDVFRTLKQLRDRIKAKSWNHAPCEYLSMGMSNDYQIAIEEGATHIRIGSSLVGPYEE